MIALSVAAALAIFVLYTALAGASVAVLTPSTIATAHGSVMLVGKVVGPIQHDGDTLRFTVKYVNDSKPGRVLVAYAGSVPSLFKKGSAVSVSGKMRHGVFAAQRDSLITKCPDHYTPAKSSSNT